MDDDHPSLGHSPGQLLLANACHPGMDDRERLVHMRRALQTAPPPRVHAVWTRRLHAAARRSAPHRWAMAMLDGWEREEALSAPRSPPLRTPSTVQPALFLFLLLLLLLVLVVAAQQG